ncbi:hypothetical protein [Janthinobacterium sp. SUN120]|uniref:hypothetical protein n=1 Tax=Janthinobacterium sp. SUN120 TaxID=3004099 RepID=UPI0025AF79CB|nr:hypothetical protein [Janthinobacterium sp. SUN120]MDN2715584.1 hypothetical protein [Janthinobacterium sp. SUN120]
MKKVLALLMVSGTVVLTGCGGGGNSSANGNANGSANGNADVAVPPVVVAPPPVVVAPPPPPALAAYVGTWTPACNDSFRQRLVVALKNDGSGALEISTYDETFSTADCSGPVQFTETTSEKITATPDGAGNIQLKLTADSPASDIRIDKVVSSLPAHTIQITGPAVTTVLVNGKPNWRITDGSGDTTDIPDTGIQQAVSDNGGFYLRGNELFTVMQKDGAYVLDMHYVKQ